MKIHLPHQYEDIISLENLLAAWKEFVRGKRLKTDVQEFSRTFTDHIIQPRNTLANRTYRHGGYESFNVADPKPRKIHKASVTDRLLHHAVYRLLYPFFDRTFMADSYSCRVNKGTHEAIRRFETMIRQVGRNNTRTCWVLKCDIRQFFASIDHSVLKRQLARYIPDQRICRLLENITDSFHTSPGKGLPLGNITSQLFVNVYMSAFDQFIKHRLRVRHYVRYADDFVILSPDRDKLGKLLPQLREYLSGELKLEFHPKKIVLRTTASGVDFLGWVHFPDHRVLRTATKRGMLRRVQEHATNETLQSYLGLLQHGNTRKLEQELLNRYWLWQED